MPAPYLSTSHTAFATNMDQDAEVMYSRKLTFSGNPNDKPYTVVTATSYRQGRKFEQTDLSHAELIPLLKLELKNDNDEYSKPGRIYSRPPPPIISTSRQKALLTNLNQLPCAVLLLSQPTGLPSL